MSRTLKSCLVTLALGLPGIVFGASCGPAGEIGGPVGGDPETRRAAQSATDCGGFDDVHGGDYYCDSVERIKDARITLGCDPPANNLYCPDDEVTRAQMASFLVRAMKISSAGAYPCGLADVSSSDPHRNDICKIKRMGITSAEGSYYPEGAMTRDAMAVFLARALDLPEASCMFPDIARNPHRKDICRVAAARITRGCNPPYNTSFCPDDRITRGMMAVFLDRAFLNPPSPAGCTPGYQLVWRDEFNSGSLDTSKWTRLRASSGINGSLSANTERSANSYVTSGGALVIKAIKERFTATDGETYPYTTARLISRDKGDLKYGYFVAKIKRNAGAGVYPSFWMLPTDNAYGPWPASGEIDIMETHGAQPYLRRVTGGLHFGMPHDHAGGAYVASTSLASDFHTFAVEWLPNRFRWWIDGRLVHTVTSWAKETSVKYPRPFDKRFHFVLTHIVGGVKGDPPADTTFPQSVQFDWVRAYQACGSDKW